MLTVQQEFSLRSVLKRKEPKISYLRKCDFASPSIPSIEHLDYRQIWISLSYLLERTSLHNELLVVP